MRVMRETECTQSETSRVQSSPSGILTVDLSDSLNYILYITSAKNVWIIVWKIWSQWKKLQFWYNVAYNVVKS